MKRPEEMFVVSTGSCSVGADAIAAHNSISNAKVPDQKSLQSVSATLKLKKKLAKSMGEFGRDIDTLESTMLAFLNHVNKSSVSPSVDPHELNPEVEGIRLG
jgi:hypothetical protein